jgi:hypothetical protein
MMRAFNHLLFVNMNSNDLIKTVVHEFMFIEKNVFISVRCLVPY